MQGLDNAGPENDGANHRAGKCNTWKMTDQTAGLKSARPLTG